MADQKQKPSNKPKLPEKFIWQDGDIVITKKDGKPVNQATKKSSK